MTDSNLVAFLNARLDEDWTSATPGRSELDDLRFELKRGTPYVQHLSSRIEDGLDGQTMVWEARVHREVEAKRRLITEITDRSSPEVVGIYLRAMATVWSDHPDYDPAWA